MFATLASALFLFAALTDQPACADEREAEVVSAPTDAPLAAFRSELLDLAFEAATAMPVKPHIKNRSRAQEACVAACLELKQPQRTLACIERIDNWRRGAAYADLALYCARQGDTAVAERYLDLAVQEAEGVEDWRRDNIRVRIAKTHAWLGQALQAEEFEKGVVASETGKVAGVRAIRSAPDFFDERVSELDRLVALGNFDILKNAMESYLDLYRRFYEDAGRRTIVEAKIKASWGDLPIFIRLELGMKLAGAALAHSDQAKALELVNEAQALFDGAQWYLEYQIPLAGKLAGLRFQAGDVEKARSDAAAALAIFDAEGHTIVDIYRARALRPLAEAFQAMGDTASALSVYRRAVEEGVVNPNSRPRAEDLSATCRSMAVHGVEPDAELWASLRRVREGLGPPW